MLEKACWPNRSRLIPGRRRETGRPNEDMEQKCKSACAVDAEDGDDSSLFGFVIFH